MDLATIEMPIDEAEEKFREYQAAVRQRHDTEDEQIMRGYKALARGHRVLKLSDTIAAGGFTTRHGPHSWGRRGNYLLPRIAVGWADQREVHSTGIRPDGSHTYWWNLAFNPQATRRNFRVPDETFDTSDVENVQTGWSWRYWTTMVPIVPPALRPAHALSGYAVLWEAEWRAHAPRPPRDPALLKPIGGDLYAVVAVWDLTELERAVLAGRTE